MSSFPVEQDLDGRGHRKRAVGALHVVQKVVVVALSELAAQVQLISLELSAAPLCRQLVWHEAIHILKGKPVVLMDVHLTNVGVGVLTGNIFGHEKEREKRDQNWICEQEINKAVEIFQTGFIETRQLPYSDFPM